MAFEVCHNFKPAIFLEHLGIFCDELITFDKHVAQFDTFTLDPLLFSLVNCQIGNFFSDVKFEAFDVRLK